MRATGAPENFQLDELHNIKIFESYKSEERVRTIGSEGTEGRTLERGGRLREGLEGEREVEECALLQWTRGRR